MEKNTLQFNSLHNQYLESWVKHGFIGLMLVTLMPLLYFMSQSFLAHNSGSIFYFFVLVLIYALVKKR